jgi:hypothetical protein
MFRKFSTEQNAELLSLNFHLCFELNPDAIYLKLYAVLMTASTNNNDSYQAVLLMVISSISYLHF